MQFRKDINGLRALAVIAVVLFHFNATWMPGGFAGVDVFFVISGFLMTGIIFRGIEHNNFSILNFYVARANRIIPALAVLCLVLLIFGWFYLTPFAYRALAKHIVGSIGFLSNLIYLSESGYFDVASQQKWLLHTWSLSVEWQFYLIYPLLLVAMRKFMSLPAMKVTLLVGTVLGFIICVVATYKWPNAAYYLLPTRAWEMMIGGVAFLYPFSIQDKGKKVLEWLSLTLIIGSYLLISEENPWPGYLALFPVLGAFLLIQAQRNDSFITGNVVSQKVGAWSYSIYLWHWPIVVAIYYFSLNDIFIYLGILLSLVLGYLSHKYIEKTKFRNDFGSLLSYLKCKPIQITLLVTVISSSIYMTKGLLFLYSDAVKNTIYAYTDLNPRAKECFGLGKKCVFGKGDVSLILIGDSHALSTITALSESIAEQNKSLVFYGEASCVTLLGDFYYKKSPRCNEFMEWVMADISSHKLPIVIVNSGAYPVGGGYLSNPSVGAAPLIEFNNNEYDDYNSKYISSKVNTVCEISKQRQVYLVRPYPRMQHKVPSYMLKAHALGNAAEYKVDKSSYLKYHDVAFRSQDLASIECGAEIIDVTTELCDETFCYGSANLVPIYSDTNHLTENGSKLLIPVFKDIFKSDF
jgi:peptidoglycan/LPS O-acetylase OafA/YrhL